MLEKIMKLFNHRYLSSQTNSFIFAGIDDFKILDNIPDKCSISTLENNIPVLTEKEKVKQLDTK